MNSAYPAAKNAQEVLILSTAAERAAIKYLLSAEARRVNRVRLSLVGA